MPYKNKFCTNEYILYDLICQSTFIFCRQHDLRTPETSKTNPKNVLINLNAHMGGNAEAKCIAINPVRPEQIAVGANDPYVRLYDRRKLTCKAMKMPEETNGRYVSYFILIFL